MRDEGHCRGLDASLALYAVAHILWRPLFGVGGHIAPPGVVSDFFRPRIESIIEAATAPLPGDRPPAEDLRLALLALVRGRVAPFFVPHNSDVTTFERMRDRHHRVLGTLGATTNATRAMDYIAAAAKASLPKLTYADKKRPIVLTKWWFKFQPSSDIASAVRLLGVYQGQSWGSSPVSETTKFLCILSS